MKRRNFLKLGGAAVASPFVLNGLPLQAFSTHNLANAMNCSEVNERALVLVQLRGGNDGLNTIIPIGQYSQYQALRPNLHIANAGANSYIDLDLTMPMADRVGLHPNMQAVKDMYDDGLVSIVQSVAYVDQNLSHFKSTDLWLSGGDGTPPNFNKQTGWMARYLDHTYPGVAGNPQPYMPDPLGIQLGDPKPSLGFHTDHEHGAGINLSGQDPSGFYSLISEIGGPPVSPVPNSEYGSELDFIMNMEASISKYAQRITEVFDNGTNMGTYPNHDLADQLKTVARLINGGCKTKIYLVKIGGFDTHVNQVLNTASHEGFHADLLLELSESIKAFLEDLKLMQLDNKVLTATFSEFGRKPVENGSLGTDHGSLAPMMIFGKAVIPGVVGTNPDFTGIQNEHFSSFQYDYRQVFTTLVQDWLGASDDAIEATEMKEFLPNKLSIVDADHYVDPACHINQITGNVTSLEEENFDPQVKLFPNPAADEFHISFQTNKAEQVNVKMFDLQGKSILVRHHQAWAGVNQVDIEIPQVVEGYYVVKLIGEGGAEILSEKLLVR
ncbi:MAG: DUF1501 domain-containing protein [Bacteroidia bacterium]|nr:DUF1501 domain-containing protein [Bacteroidia bacterium]